MTHSLHRRGTAESLSEDYVMLCLPAIGINDEGHDQKLQEFLRITLRHDPVNIGAITLGNMYSHKTEEVVNAAHGIVHAVFVKQDDVTEVLKELDKANLGMSVVVSGIFEKVDECCEKAGLKHHTANFSLGIWGRTEKLPSDDILEVTTMCGHAMISANLVKDMVREIKAGTKTPEEAAKVLAPQCACGIFNPVRAAKLLAAMAAKES
ncbi:MAG TPA: hypothetical protein G4O01_00745 [Dehalococcoidia bacterium]|jgi:hypothetical protein|nr:hypothetical protein [Dehalococcoidia bacterium]